MQLQSTPGQKIFKKPFLRETTSSLVLPFFLISPVSYVFLCSIVITWRLEYFIE